MAAPVLPLALLLLALANSQGAPKKAPEQQTSGAPPSDPGADIANTALGIGGSIAVGVGVPLLKGALAGIGGGGAGGGGAAGVGGVGGTAGGGGGSVSTAAVSTQVIAGGSSGYTGIVAAGAGTAEALANAANFALIGAVPALVIIGAAAAVIIVANIIGAAQRDAQEFLGFVRRTAPSPRDLCRFENELAAVAFADVARQSWVDDERLSLRWAVDLAAGNAQITAAGERAVWTPVKAVQLSAWRAVQLTIRAAGLVYVRARSQFGGRLAEGFYWGQPAGAPQDANEGIAECLAMPLCGGAVASPSEQLAAEVNLPAPLVKVLRTMALIEVASLTSKDGTGYLDPYVYSVRFAWALMGRNPNDAPVWAMQPGKWLALGDGLWIVDHHLRIPLEARCEAGDGWEQWSTGTRSQADRDATCWYAIPLLGRGQSGSLDAALASRRARFTE